MVRCDGDYWALDKRVAVALLLFIVVQFATVVWWAATTNASVQDHARRLTRLEQIVETIPTMGRDIQWLRKFLERQDAKRD